MLGGVREIELAQNAARFRGRNGGLQCGGGVRVQVIERHTDHRRGGAMDAHQVSHTMRQAPGRASLGELDRPPALQGLEDHQQVTGTSPAMLVGVAHGLPRRGRQGSAGLTDHLVGTLIEPDQRIPGLIGLGIASQAIFQAPATLRARAGNTPGLLVPRLGRAVFSVRRTASSEIAATTWCSTSLSASSCTVQRARPSGGVLQARAVRQAPCLPSSLRRPPGRGRPLKAASRPSSAKRWRSRSTVAVPTWRARAMALPARPASAWRNRWARVHRRAAPLPRVVSATKRARSASGRVTIYVLAMAPSRFGRTVHEKNHGINIAAIIH